MVYPTVESISSDIDFKTFGKLRLYYWFDIYGHPITNTDEIGAKRTIIANSIREYAKLMKENKQQKSINCVFMVTKVIEAVKEMYTNSLNKQEQAELKQFKGHCKSYF